jgi:predicted Zn-dependent protease
MYGDDPKQGVVDGRKFTHPDFRLAFEAPAGFYLLNGTRAVAINGQSGRGQLSTGEYNGNMGAYIGNVFAGLTERGQQPIRPSTIETTTVNGIPAAYAIARVDSGNGQVDVVVYAYEFGPNQAFHFLTISQAGSAGAFEPMFKSMRRINATEAAAVKTGFWSSTRCHRPLP